MRTRYKMLLAASVAACLALAQLPRYPVGGGAAAAATAWGAITGTLSNQTDLNSALGAKAPTADPVFTSSVQLPNGTSPTVDGAGEIAVDTTTDQLQFFGAAKRALATTLPTSFVVPAPLDTDDFNLGKAAFGMTIAAVDCIVQGTTSVTGQLQECDATGGSCADLDSDIVCDADGAADDGTLTDPTIAAGNWLRWKTTSVSGSPTFLTVTVRYRVNPD